MITFTIIGLIVLAIIIALVVSLFAGALGLVVAFGDLIVAGLLIWFIVKIFIRKKKKK